LAWLGLVLFDRLLAFWKTIACAINNSWVWFALACFSLAFAVRRLHADHVASRGIVGAKGVLLVDIVTVFERRFLAWDWS
jgi:hypothetical protein